MNGLNTSSDLPTLEDTVEKHLRRDLPRICSGISLREALDVIRLEPLQSTRIVYYYVTDPDDKLIGVLPVRSLLLGNLDHPVNDLMILRPVAIPSIATIFDACEFFTMYRFLAFPVVDETGKLLGRLDIDIYQRELSSLEETPAAHTYDDLFQLIGVHWENAKNTGWRPAFRMRFPWLLCNVAGGLLAAGILGLFEDELEKFVVLSLFIPVVLALAESVAIQSVTLALERLHGDTLTWKKLRKKLADEALTGLALGLATAIVVGVFSILRGWDHRLFASLLIGICGGVTAAATCGILIPNLLKLFKKDPKVAAGPISLVLADMATLTIYLLSAKWFFA